MKPPNSVQLCSYVNRSSGPPNISVSGPATVIVEEFVAYIGAPSAIERSAMVVIDATSPDPGGTIWEAHVDIGGLGSPVYFATNGRWIFTIPFEGPQDVFGFVPTTGSWDFSASGFVLSGANPNWPLQFG